MDRRGSSLKKITDETGRLFNDEGYHVEYYNNNGFFMVTIYNANYGKNGNVTKNFTNVTKYLTNLENQVLELIKQGTNTTKDLIVKTEKTKMSISRTTASLQQKHLIARAGSNRIGHWEVKNNKT